MRPVVVMSMLHEAAEPHSGTRSFHGKPVLDWTLRRLSLAGAIGQRAILCWDDQASAIQAVAAEYGASIFTTGPRTSIPSLDAVTTARRWADGWRGGPLQTCEFDRGFHAPWLLELAKKREADSLVLVDPAAGLVDPQLIDGLIAQAEANPNRPMIFSQAAPGLSGMLIRVSLIEQLAAMKIHPGKFLHYQPSQPVRDPISEPHCAPVPMEVARSTGRFTLDTSRQIRRMESATTEFHGQLIHTDAVGLVRLTRRLMNDSLREVALELTTRRATKPIFLPAGHLEMSRADLGITSAMKVIKELQSMGEEDHRLTLGGAGDPLLADHVFEVIEAAAAAGIAVHLKTDFVGVSSQTIGKLASSPVDIISIQIPAITAKTYLAVMGVDGLYQVVQNIKLFVEQRAASARQTPILMPVFTKCQQNLAEMEIWYDKWLAALGSAVIHGASDFAGQIPDHAAADMSPPARRECGKISSRLTVLSDGCITACDQDPLGIQTVGRIEKETVDSVWTQAMGRLREDHRCGEWNKHQLCARCRNWHRAA